MNLQLKITPEDLQRWLRVVMGYVNDLVAVMRDKGPKHLARPLGVAAAVLFALHRFVYSAPEQRLKQLDLDLAGARMTAQHATRYQELQERLNYFTATLPSPKETDNWLLSVVRDAMKTEGIYFTSLTPVEARPHGGFLIYSMTVTCRANYKQMASWIATLERSKKMLHISSLSVAKDAQDIGMNTVTLTVSTVVPGSRAP